MDGISEKLPYLKTLGVTALYLNPVFTAPSVHKYDTEDYRHVDPQFGGDTALLRLRHNTQQQGMRLILDGVFNHSGDSHAWFDRHSRGTDGACHNPESPARLVSFLSRRRCARLAGVFQLAQAGLFFGKPSK